ncbi:MAG: hypothetical protein K6U79_08030 [Firmicutes bacterium]|nr:hypothetical protein [Bacillota bacterium]
MGWSWMALLAAGVVRLLMLLVGYVSGGGGSFPHPLSPEEEADCLRRMALGDRAARAKLIEHNLRLVAHLAKKFEVSGEESDDLISVGTIGLIKGIETYDTAKGTKLATYAARCIENESSMTSPAQAGGTRAAGGGRRREPAPARPRPPRAQLPASSPASEFSPSPCAVASPSGSSCGMQITWPICRL